MCTRRSHVDRALPFGSFIAASRADGAGPRARLGHVDHLHLEVPDIDPALPMTTARRIQS